MSQDLFGKWYVYRYTLKVPVLKASETTLDIQPTEEGCLARFELNGWAEPVGIEMTADRATGDWISKKGDSFLDFRWSPDKHGSVLVGQVVNLDNSDLEERDFFVAARSRRTYRLPDRAEYRFGGAYLVPYETDTRSRSWHERHDPPGVEIKLGENKLIRMGASTYQFKTWTRYQGGLLIEEANIREEEAEPKGSRDRLAIWILPVAESGQSERLLATGYWEYRRQVDSGAAAGCHNSITMLNPEE